MIRCFKGTYSAVCQGLLQIAILNPEFVGEVRAKSKAICGRGSFSLTHGLFYFGPIRCPNL